MQGKKHKFFTLQNSLSLSSRNSIQGVRQQGRLTMLRRPREETQKFHTKALFEISLSMPD